MHLPYFDIAGKSPIAFLVTREPVKISSGDKIRCILKLSFSSTKSTTPVQALKHCARLLRRRSQHLPFIPAKAGMKAGYESFFVSSSTHNRTYLAVPLSLYFEIVSYTHFPDSLHNSLLLLHFHAHSLSLHNNLMTRNFLPRVFS